MSKDISELGSILGIWAHPDDEAWSMAGMMMRALDNDQKVYLVTATRGEAGNIDGCDDCDRKELASMREREMAESLACIGDIQHQWLEYKDGKMKDVDVSEASEEIAKIIKKIQPDSIVTFEPRGITGHDDHRAISEWTTVAVGRLVRKPKLLYSVETKERYEEIGSELDEKFNIYFNTDMPFLIDEDDAEVKMVLNPKELKCKMACLEAHASQLSHMFADAEMKRYIEQLAATEAFISSSEPSWFR